MIASGDRPGETTFSACQAAIGREKYTRSLADRMFPDTNFRLCRHPTDNARRAYIVCILYLIIRSNNRLERSERVIVSNARVSSEMVCCVLQIVLANAMILAPHHRALGERENKEGGVRWVLTKLASYIYIYISIYLPLLYPRFYPSPVKNRVISMLKKAKLYL